MSDVIGVDVSHWQGDMDWDRCLQAGAVFAFVRAGSISTSGVLYADYKWERNKIEAPLRLPCGAYWFFRPQFDPVSQADFFCALLEGVELKLPPVLDVESDGGLSPAAYADAIKACLDRIEARYRKPIIYTSRSKWAYVEPRPYWGNYELWVAHYTTSDTPLLPSAWQRWTFWQFTASGDGPAYGAQSASIDLNRFNGTLDEFNAYIGDNQMRFKFYRAKSKGAIVRRIADNVAVGLLPPNIIFLADEESLPDQPDKIIVGEIYYVLVNQVESIELL